MTEIVGCATLLGEVDPRDLLNKTAASFGLGLQCEVAPQWAEVEAAEGGKKLPTFRMLAYTGRSMRIEGFFRPVVVDLTGVEVRSKQIPILRGHDPDRIVGHGTATVSAKDIQAEGVVSAETEHSREVVTSSKNGFPWQVSIGASVVELESFKEGQKVTVNGRTVAGPVLVARKTTLNEISFVPRGADHRTSAKVAAQAAQHQQRVTLAELHRRTT